jgi:hypothetical protein
LGGSKGASAATASYGRSTIRNYVIVDLEFESSSEAEAFRAALGDLWRRAEAEGLIEGPRARIVEAVDSKEY